MNPATTPPGGNRARGARVYDVFNGDADGLLARHQFRLAYPPESHGVTLVTGVKRDIALLQRIDVEGDGPLHPLHVNVFDISYDRNASAVDTLLAAGARIKYFDHHRAARQCTNALLDAQIDESPDMCSSLLVDRHLRGAHRAWAIAAAFGDNLAAVAGSLAREAGYSSSQIAQLKELGECLNYNAYGETISDLHFDPAALAMMLQPYADPFIFLENESAVAALKSGYESDLASALEIEASHSNRYFAVYLLPNDAWSRRISGVFANHLVHHFPGRAHAVITQDAGNAPSCTVSIRAPRNAPRDASTVASLFPQGGGRAAAAGIESFTLDRLPDLIAALDQTWRN